MRRGGPDSARLRQRTVKSPRFRPLDAGLSNSSTSPLSASRGTLLSLLSSKTGSLSSTISCTSAWPVPTASSSLRARSEPVPGFGNPDSGLGVGPWPTLSHPFGWLDTKPAFSHPGLVGPSGWLGTKPALSPFRVAGRKARSLTLGC